MTWTFLSETETPVLRPRPANRLYALKYDAVTGKLGYPELEAGDFVLPVPETHDVFYPVQRQSEDPRLGYDPDWRVALALEAGYSSTRLLSWLKQRPEQWLANHPKTQLPAWFDSLKKTFTDAELIRLWKTQSPQTLAGLFKQEPVLEGALQNQRPQLADWLWEAGARPQLPATLLHVLNLDIAQSWKHLGGNHLKDGELDPFKSLPKSAGTYADLPLDQAMTHYAKVWQSRLKPLGLALSGPGYTYDVTHRGLGNDPDRVVQEDHTAASILLGPWFRTKGPCHFKNVADAFEGIKLTWAHWLDQQGISWADAGPQEHGQSRQDLVNYIGTSQQDVWRTWVRERMLTRHKPDTSQRSRPRA